MAKSLRVRFDAYVDRTGEHHLWTGAVRGDTGVGRLKVDGKVLPAPQVAWELEHGSAAGGRVLPCPDVPACVRVDHLRLCGSDGRPAGAAAPRRSRGRSGAGSLREVSPGLWELSVSAGKYDDGRPRREYRRVRAENRADAHRQLAALVVELCGQPAVVPATARDLTLDVAVEHYLTEHLLGEKGREPKTVDDYRRLHRKWFSPLLGSLPLRAVDEAAIDDVFGRMRRGGLSRSRMNQARSMYGPFFRWARRRRFITRNPMMEFDLPTSIQVSKERTPPEVEQLSALLNASVEFVPDIAPVLTLGAVTGMRRGELVGLRRSNILWGQGRLLIDTAIDSGRRVKSTKTRRERSLHVDDATVGMLRRHCDAMDERAARIGVAIAPDAFVFSLEPDCSQAMPPDYFTKRVAVLKDHLGVAEKRPDTAALEDEALRLFRSSSQPRRAGKTGPAPKGGLSFREIGSRLGRSERWAAMAVAGATRREQAGPRVREKFDASILALRKFTSSELLDAGFNISMVAERQGHGPQVLIKHYAKSRRSADRRAAEHLGSVVHGQQSTATSEAERTMTSSAREQLDEPDRPTMPSR